MRCVSSRDAAAAARMAQPLRLAALHAGTAARRHARRHVACSRRAASRYQQRALQRYIFCCVLALPWHRAAVYAARGAVILFPLAFVRLRVALGTVDARFLNEGSLRHATRARRSFRANCSMSARMHRVAMLSATDGQHAARFGLLYLAARSSLHNTRAAACKFGTQLTIDTIPLHGFGDFVRKR